MFKNKKATKEDVSAILWDFDGTIVDSMYKHFLVNKKIYSLIKPNVKREKWPDALSSLEKYVKAEYESINWRDLYEKHLKFSKKEVEKAKNFWWNLSEKKKTPNKIFECLQYT